MKKEDDYVEIRKMNVNELSIQKVKIQSLLNVTYKLNFEISTSKSEQLAAEKTDSMLDYINADEGFVYGAFDSVDLAGFVWFFVYEKIGEKRVHINQIVVDSEFRRKGIAKKLLNMVESFAKEHNIKKIDLNVSSNNLAAINLYSQNDFKNESVLMSKKI